nr:histidine--tRNA ligase, cytoplasmic [Tanacetum cinerariifolium]
MAGGDRRVLTLGGKGSLLSEASVFKFANASPRQILKIDPSALVRLSSSPSGHKLKSSSPFKLQLSVPDYLTPEEARASILVLLNMLLMLGGSASPVAASQLSDILNNDAQTFTLDLEFDRQDDVDLLKDCWPDIISVAIGALLDYTATWLSKVADTITALSCEALKTDTTTAFNFFTDSSDGFSDKDSASVPSDFTINSLVNTGQIEFYPVMHGSAGKDLTGCFSSLVYALGDLGSELIKVKEVVADAKPEKKKDKKKKALGKGSDLLTQFIKDRLHFDQSLQKVKEVVDSNESRRLPKIPKGTRDLAKEQMSVRERAFSRKYGDDSKLIFDLADQGGELCSSRYDLTVPFARYVAMNGITSFKRYQIGKVYRREKPSKGRYREFYQCDFDIACDESIGADFEVVKILIELLDELNIGEYEIKLNHRKLLDGMLDICGVPSDKFRTVCSSIDKLDKQTFEEIKKELIDEKGGGPFLTNDSTKQALNDLDKLFQLLDTARCVHKVVLDLSLARGIDYYTGLIYEAVSKGDIQVGSIAAGGRYDDLIAKFGTKRVAAIGVSLGIERIFTILEQKQKDDKQLLRASETQVLVSIWGDDYNLAVKLVTMCWDANLKAEFWSTKGGASTSTMQKSLGFLGLCWFMQIPVRRKWHVNCGRVFPFQTLKPQNVQQHVQ